MRGLIVRSLFVACSMAEWDGRDSSGEKVHAGLFFVALEVDGQRLASRRLTILR